MNDAGNASLSGKTSEDMAGRVGVSARTHERVKFILKEGQVRTQFTLETASQAARYTAHAVSIPGWDGAAGAG